MTIPSQRNGKPLPAGKLPAGLLAAFLQTLPVSDERVVVGAQYGEDAAVIDLGDHYLVIAMDPVTLSAEPGRIAVQINANDIAVMGAEPRWLLAAILLPPGSTDVQAGLVMEQLRDGCAELGVSLIGGHTEVTPGVTHPVVTCCMIGEVAPDRLVTGAGARLGDTLLLAGPIAVEGTGILAREYADVLRTRGVPENYIREGAVLLDEPGISVLSTVRTLMGATLPHAMHDPTEGGILTALREMATASQVGLRVEADRIPVHTACRAICDVLAVDPLALLASGSLLAAVDPVHAAAAQRALMGEGIDSAVIGTVGPQDAGMVLLRNGVSEPLPEVERDELARWIDETS